MGEKLQKRITVGTVNIGDQAKGLINQILDSNRISQGKYVAQFENKFARYHGLKNCVAVSTGTEADALALAVVHDLNGNRGDEVIVPALTFVATANAVIHAGLTPRFVDINPQSYNIEPSLIESAITEKTRAIMPVHLFGRPAAMDEIMAIAKKYDLLVVEDAAEAHGAKYKGKLVGTIGDLGAFSFYIAHIITTGEGGAVITDNDDYAELLRSLRAHGRACKCKKCILNIDSRYCPLRFEYGEDVDARFYFERIGYSCKMNELEAALGIEQVSLLDKIIRQRRKNLSYLTKKLKRYESYFQLFEEVPHEKISPLAYPLVIKKDAPFTRANIIDFLEKRGIETRPMFYSIPTQQPAYKFMGHRLGDFPNAEFVGKNGFYIGVHQDLGKEDLDYVAETIEAFLNTI